MSRNVQAALSIPQEVLELPKNLRNLSQDIASKYSIMIASLSTNNHLINQQPIKEMKSEIGTILQLVKISETYNSANKNDTR